MAQGTRSKVALASYYNNDDDNDATDEIRQRLAYFEAHYSHCKSKNHNSFKSRDPRDSSPHLSHNNSVILSTNRGCLLYS